MTIDYSPVIGCEGCKGTAGRWGCPYHNPFAPMSEIPKIQMVMCYKCGKIFDIAWSCPECQIAREV